MDIDIDKIAGMARIKLTREERDELQPQLTTILTYVETLRQVDTQGVVATAHPHDSALALRPDVVTSSDQRESLLAVAPQSDAGLFVVPKVIE
ncbi:MAG: Asp-tRNA(Asn)/Glu-tRNA(Gln) amidotransferase subunit GatC [Mariprofundales bacterium]|nr:Asp-tRNA(Asn)/Glu-tRNA(Gln) amidotransferase subunit GatC [Mariprofundales bacterium]